VFPQGRYVPLPADGLGLRYHLSALSSPDEHSITTFSVGWFREIRIVSFGIVPNQPALTATFLSTCASASFGRVTASTPFMNLVLILSVSMPSGT